MLHICCNSHSIFAINVPEEKYQNSEQAVLSKKYKK
jgi:hypothetical protein